MIHLKNTSILITGGGSGIGKGTAIHLAEKGAKIVICGRREEKLKVFGVKRALPTAAERGVSTPGSRKSSPGNVGTDG